MKDDTSRPGSGDKGLPAGTRARNRTMIIGAERVSSLVGAVERAAPVEPVIPIEESRANDLDPLGLDSFEQDEFVAPVARDDFQSLDEIFGGSSEGEGRRAPDGASQSFNVAGVASKDASSTLMGDLGLDDDFQSALDVFEPTASVSAPVSAPKIVRSTSGNITPPPHIMPTDVFDPFAAMEAEQVDTPQFASEAPVAPEREMESVFTAMDDAPFLAEEPAPEIVRSGDIGAANERIIIPPSLSAATTAVAAATETVHVVSPQRAMSSHAIATDAELMTQPRDQIYWKSESPLIGFLVTYDHDPKGSYVELRQGRLMVSNQREESGSCLVVIGESVSPMHAIMRVAPGGIVQVLDQLSEAGTRVKHFGQSEEEFLSGEKSSVSHGDIVFFGDRKFHVLLVVGEADDT